MTLRVMKTTGMYILIRSYLRSGEKVSFHRKQIVEELQPGATLEKTKKIISYKKDYLLHNSNDNSFIRTSFRTAAVPNTISIKTSLLQPFLRHLKTVKNSSTFS